MENDSTLYVGLDVHKDSITVAYAIGTGEVELLGKIGTTLDPPSRFTATSPSGYSTLKTRNRPIDRGSHIILGA